jgi:hypothetical protein
MCHVRLQEGREPACVHACPEGAITIEIVNIAQWREEYRRGANAPGMPSADDSLSTTRLTLPEALPQDTEKVNTGRVRPEHPHWPLIVMTVLTQLSVGALAALWLAALARGARALSSSCHKSKLAQCKRSNSASKDGGASTPARGAACHCCDQASSLRTISAEENMCLW